jgi:hypothetical protein
MSYLYGDSTPSTLQINFIDFLRDVIDCSVQILNLDRRIREGGEELQKQRKAAEMEVVRLEALGEVVSRAVDGADVGGESSPTVNCAEAIVRSSADLVHAEIERVRGMVRNEEARLSTQATRERMSCVQALSALLLRHDLPEQTIDVRFVQQSATHYEARLHLQSPFGLEAVMALEMPAGHPMAHVLRVDKLLERLEVQAPEAAGWLKKEVKLRPQRLEKEFVTELVMKEGETTIKLRANADGSGAGCDLTMKPPRVLFVRAGNENDPTPFELAEADAQRILELQDKLLDAGGDLIEKRKELVEARLDGVPLAEHTDPRLLAERLIALITPAVQEISKRSLSPTELVLKRQLDSGRREEIFISRDELRQKLSSLSESHRALFAPLGLTELPVPAPPVPWRPSPSAIRPKAQDEERTVVDPIPAMIDDTPVPSHTK